MAFSESPYVLYPRRWNNEYVWFAAAQALDFREFTPGKGSLKAREVIRKYVEHLNVDRPLYNDHNAMKKLVKRGEILVEVEKVVGELAQCLPSSTIHC